MRILMIGAGAMGSSYGARLSAAGADVCLLDPWQVHVDTVNRDGLEVDGVFGHEVARVQAATAVTAAGTANIAFIFVNTNDTRSAAESAAAVLATDGFAVTMQNGIGNLETLQEVLGAERVLGGSSMSSAMMRGPGKAALTHLGPTSIGEVDGSETARVREFAALLNKAGFETKIDTDITAKIWNKFVLNVAINALCATTGLRLGELARLPELNAMQDRVIEEIIAVTEAKGITIPDPDVRRTIKRHCWKKFSRPSMLQHIEAGKRTEIDALNGALVREGKNLGIATPYNEAVVALLKGREQASMRDRGPTLDYETLEAKAQSTEPPGI
ncbi:MAG: 2-dehydropantoate 2-reductase [Pseudomonadota bacterium]